MEEKEGGVHPDLGALSGDTLRVWTPPVNTAAAKSASLSGSSETFIATWFIEKLVIWPRNKGLSRAMSLKTETISDMNARMCWSSRE